MASVKYNIKIERGADKVIPIRWGVNSTITGVFEPYNLTGCTARLQVRAEVGSVAVLDEMTTANGRIVIDTINKKISLIFPNAWSTAALWSDGMYQLELIDSAALVHRLVYGTITIDQESTRA